MNAFEWPLDPDLLFDAARDVRCFQLEKNGELRYFLLFVRTSRVLDQDLHGTDGVMVALFECDGDGKVFDWNERFEVEGRNTDVAFFRFVYRFVNDLATPTDVRRLAQLPDDECDRLDAMMTDDSDRYPVPDFDDP